MNAKGMNQILFILILIGAGIFATAFTIFIFAKSDSNSTQTQIPELSDASSQAENVDLSPNETNFSNETEENDDQESEIEHNQTTNQSQESNDTITGPIIDLEAFNVYLGNDGCSNTTADNTTCDMFVIGTITNNGTEEVTTGFTAHLLDVTNIVNGGVELIESFQVNESIAVGEYINVSDTYRSIKPGKYWIRLSVDVHNDIDEYFEDNNLKTEILKIA